MVHRSLDHFIINRLHYVKSPINSYVRILSSLEFIKVFNFHAPINIMTAWRVNCFYYY